MKSGHSEAVTAASSEPVLTESTPTAHWVQFNRPAVLNALSIDTLHMLRTVVNDLAIADPTRPLVLTGNGSRAFSAGFDVEHLAGSSPKELTRLARSGDTALREACEALVNFPNCVIALIRGHCIGAAIELMLSCDIRMAMANASFWMPAAPKGITYPEHGMSRLVDTVGRAAALRIVLLAERLDAAAAERLGLIHRVLPTDADSADIAPLLERISSHHLGAVSAMKRAIYRN